MFDASNADARSRTWSVVALLGAVAGVLEHDFAACSVSGELSGFSRAASGHCYFNLKDPGGGASIRCAMFRRAAALLPFTPRDGLTVEVRGRLALYEPRGELQFVVEGMLQEGAGALYERFLRLRAQLEAEGLFAADAKRALPRYPRRIGIVTSLAGAALHDIAITLARRSPQVEVVVYPSLVQGADAPAALCHAIAMAAQRVEVEVLMVCRGGGSIEDLWAFNDERVVRAVRAAPMPVLSGVGHETDVTLVDLAADVRAATPTAAAELVAPEQGAQFAMLDAAEAAARRRLMAALDAHEQRLDRLSLLMARPGDGLQRRRHLLAMAGARLARGPLAALQASQSKQASSARRMLHAVTLARTGAASRLASIEARLGSVDPDRVLARGYALLTGGDGHAVTSVTQMAAGESVEARLHDGAASLRVESLRQRR